MEVLGVETNYIQNLFPYKLDHTIPLPLHINLNLSKCSKIFATHTANIYSQFTVIGCVTCATVFLQWLLQATTVHMTFNDTEEYSLRSIAILGCNMCSQITVAHVTLPKAVLSTVKIFAV